MHTPPQVSAKRLLKGKDGDSKYEERRPQSHSDSGLAQTSTLAFVTFTTLEEAKGLKHRSLVRSHALKDYHAKLKREKVARRVADSAHLSKSGNEAAGYGEVVRWAINPSPRKILGAGTVDPFSSFPRSLSYNEHIVLEYYITHFCAKNDPIYPPEFSKALSTIWLPRAIKELGMLDGMLLIAARDLMSTAPSKALGNLVLQLRGRVIQDVNAAISDERRAVKDESIATLLQLAFDEISTGNQKALNSHAKALKLIIKLRGALPTTGFQGFLSFLIERVDLISAFYKTPPPQPHSSAVAPIPHPLSVENINAGFLAPQIMSNLSPSMITVLDNFCALSEFIDSHPNAAFPPVGAFEIEGKFSNYEAEWSQILSGRTESEERFENPDVEECMIEAVRIYRRTVFYESDRAVTDGHSYRIDDAGQIKEQMSRFTAGVERLAGSGGRRVYLELLMWMVFVGSLEGSSGVGYGYWVSSIWGFASELGITTWQEAQAVLSRFLWLSWRCDAHGKGLWDWVERMMFEREKGYG